jgi:hypothetical protein
MIMFSFIITSYFEDIALINQLNLKRKIRKYLSNERKKYEEIKDDNTKASSFHKIA